MYKALRKTIQNGTHLELDVANSVAVAMKEWAIENGATHYTHWFQPMTNFTAENMTVYFSCRRRTDHYGFSGKELVKESRMPPAFHPEDFVQLLKPEATLHGIRLLRLLSKIVLFIFRRLSVPTAERLWTKNSSSPFHGYAEQRSREDSSSSWK